VPTESDGFFQFNERAVKNLAYLLAETDAAVVLTTSHRINYSLTQWQEFLLNRGLRPRAISKINMRTALPPAGSRAAEIEDWVNRLGQGENYVVVDDDLSLHGLPAAIKHRCVLTKPLIGLDEIATQQALTIFRANQQ